MTAAATKKRGRGRPPGAKNKPKKDPEASAKKATPTASTARKAAAKKGAQKTAKKAAPPADNGKNRQGFLTEEIENELAIAELDAAIVGRKKADLAHSKAAQARKDFTGEIRDLMRANKLEEYTCRTWGVPLGATRTPHDDDISVKELAKEP